MTSQLGDLPGFGRHGNTRGARSSGLDTALESLLDGNSGPQDQTKPRSRASASGKGLPPKHRTGEGDSQISTNVADDFDASDNEMPNGMSEQDTKKLAESLDVESLDANLFGSFSRKKRSGKKKDSGSKQSSKGIINSPDQGRGVKSSEGSLQRPQKRVTENMDSRTSSKPALGVDNGRDDDLDDILDLLSADDSKRRATTETKSSPRTPSEHVSQVTSVAEGKPITYSSTINRGGENEVHAHKKYSTSSDNHGTTVAKDSNRLLSLTTDSISRPKFKPSQVNFDDNDDDDILSGLGFEDDKVAPPTNNNLAVASQQRGVQKAHQTKEKAAPPTSKSAVVGEGEEETVQFGGYIPSVSDSSSKSSERRRGRGESSSLTLRPSTAPSAAKKTVRFSEQLEESERPSSAMLTRETPKLTLKGSRRVEAKDAKATKPVVKERSASDSRVVQIRDENVSEQVHPLTSRVQSSLKEDENQVNSLEAESREWRTLSQDRMRDSSSQLEHPVFPWQKAEQSAVKTTSRQSRSSRTTLPQESQRMSEDSGTLSGGELGRERGEPQVEMGRDRGVPREELEKVRGELSTALQSVHEIELVTEKEKTENARLKDLLSDSQKRVSEALDRQNRLEEEAKQHRSEVTELENAKRKAESELREKFEECKIKLYKAELERDQLQQLMEMSKQHQREEVESVQKSHSLRLTSMEESLSRRESRWKDELEAEGTRWQEKLQQVDREKTDAVLALRRKMGSIEVSKTNEISRLQGIHRSSIDDVKREYEMDRQHLVRLHDEEVEALKAAHSHTRTLAELSSKVEASTREVGHLHAKLSDAHGKLMEEKALRNKSQEHHLKTLEERLASQQAETNMERERLQSLVAKLEAHISQQSKSVEQERWQLQQEAVRLKAQQAAFKEERNATLSKLEEEKEHFQTAREHFLAEQQEILTKCYQEQREVASERSQVALLKKKAEEREIREKKKSIQLSEEASQISAEASSLREQQEELKVEGKALESDRGKLEAFAKEIQKRSEEIDELCKSSVELRERGERELLEAKKLKEEVSEESRSIQSQLAELREKEQQIAADSLLLAEQRRAVQREISMNRSSNVNGFSLRLHELMEGTRQDAIETSSSLSNSSENQLHSSKLPHHQTLFLSSAPPHKEGMVNKGYSPRTSPSHLNGPDLGLKVHSQSLQSYLTQIEHNKNLREMVTAAERDYEDLEKESDFLASLGKKML